MHVSLSIEQPYIVHGFANAKLKIIYIVTGIQLHRKQMCVHSIFYLVSVSPIPMIIFTGNLLQLSLAALPAWILWQCRPSFPVKRLQFSLQYL